MGGDKVSGNAFEDLANKIRPDNLDKLDTINLSTEQVYEIMSIFLYSNNSIEERKQEIIKYAEENGLSKVEVEKIIKTMENIRLKTDKELKEEQKKSGTKLKDFMSDFLKNDIKKKD